MPQRAESESEVYDHPVGLQARLLSQALRNLTSNLNKSQTILIFINQLREKIGVMFGSPETTPGGRALKFYSSVRLDIRRIEAIKDGLEVVGNRTRVKVVKNKCAPPFRQAEFDIMYGRGISREGSVIDLGVDLGIVKKSGAWYTYEGEQLGQGGLKLTEEYTGHRRASVQQIFGLPCGVLSAAPDGPVWKLVPDPHGDLSTVRHGARHGADEEHVLLPLPQPAPPVRRL